MNRGALEAIFNPEDLNALEMALEIKGRHGGTVTVITMGPPKAANILRESLFRGADKVILLTDRKFAGADTLATSYALMCAVRKLGQFDLILAAGRPSTATPPRWDRRPPRSSAFRRSRTPRRSSTSPRPTSPPNAPSTRAPRSCAARSRACSPSSARPNTPRPASVRRQMARKLSAAPGEYAALRTKWPEFETDEALEAFLAEHDLKIPRLDRRRHRRDRGQHRAGRLSDTGPQDQTSWSWRAARADDRADAGRHQGDDRRARP